MTNRRKLSEEEQQDAGRLAAIWERHQAANPGLTQDQFSAQCGWKSQGAFYQYKAGIVPLNLNALLKFSRAFGVQPEDISPSLAKKIDTARDPDLSTDERADKYVYIDIVRGPRLSAGSGEVLWDYEEIDKSHAFQREWIQKKGLRVQRCKLWEVKGDSMSPTLNSGDVVLINMADREVQSGHVYALICSDGLRVKRLIRRSDSVVVMHSDNPLQHMYPPEPIMDQTAAVIGRVVWKAGEI